LLDKYSTGIIKRESFVEVVPYLYEVDFNPPLTKQKQKLVPKLSLSDPADIFVKVKKVGKGSFGQVFQAIDNRTNQVLFHFSFFIFHVNNNHHKLY